MDNYKIISSTTNPKIKELSKLKEKKYRLLNKEFLIEGYHLVEEAYKNKRLKEIFVLDKKDISKFKDINTTLVSLDVIKKLSDTTTPQPIIGLCEMKKEKIDYKNYNHILVLDNVSDPGNIGTLIRTALGFNIDLVVLSEESCDVYNSKVLRSTQGAIFSLPIVYKKLSDEILKMKEKNIKVISTSLKANTTLTELKKIDKYAIILGNEANGVKDEIQSMSDLNVIIPINNKLESLNVSVAGAIIMYEVQKI